MITSKDLSQTLLPQACKELSVAVGSVKNLNPKGPVICLGISEDLARLYVEEWN